MTLLPSNASTWVHNSCSFPILSNSYNQTSVLLIFGVSIATVWLLLGLVIENVPWSKIPWRKWLKNPVLLLDGPLPSSLYKNAKLFPGYGGSSKIVSVMSVDTTSKRVARPSIVLVKLKVGTLVLILLNLYCSVLIPAILSFFCLVYQKYHLQAMLCWLLW